MKGEWGVREAGALIRFTRLRNKRRIILKTWVDRAIFRTLKRNIFRISNWEKREKFQFSIIVSLKITLFFSMLSRVFLVRRRVLRQLSGTQILSNFNLQSLKLQNYSSEPFSSSNLHLLSDIASAIHHLAFSKSVRQFQSLSGYLNLMLEHLMCGVCTEYL